LLAGCTVHSFPPLPIYILKSERLSYSYLLTPLMYVSTILKETFSSSIACFLKWGIFPQFTSTISVNGCVLCIHSFTVHNILLFYIFFPITLFVSLLRIFFLEHCLPLFFIGAEGTPYHDGLFFFDLYLPYDFPNVPPVCVPFIIICYLSCRHSLYFKCY
jgi:hypothetical protein